MEYSGASASADAEAPLFAAGPPADPAPIWVNKRGRRYVDEDYILQFFQMAPGWSPPDTYITHIPLPGLEREMRKPRDVVKMADSWGEVADWMDVEPAVLEATVDEYNAACDQGHGPVFGKAREYLRPLRTPPFYAIIGRAHICDTVGGIKIDENMQVIDTAGEPVRGLYAAGVVTGGWEAETYDYHLTRHLVGFAINSGRIAAESAVESLRC